MIIKCEMKMINLENEQTNTVVMQKMFATLHKIKGTKMISYIAALIHNGWDYFGGFYQFKNC